MTTAKRLGKGIRTFASDIADGFFVITHNGFAFIGLVVMFAALTLFFRPDLREQGEVQLTTWLKSRQPDPSLMESDTQELGAVDRATAIDPQDLPKQQAAVAKWISKKYRVAPEPISAIVAETYSIGKRNKLDPALILAIMAIESSFNPFAQSSVGAQGLMQVMTQVHADKYLGFGGNLAAFDPLTNLRVGVKVLQECIERAGSIEGGLKFYVGAANFEHDDGYGSKVLAEYSRLQMVAAGRVVPLTDPRPAASGASSSTASSAVAPSTLPAIATTSATTHMTAPPSTPALTEPAVSKVSRTTTNLASTEPLSDRKSDSEKPATHANP